MIQLPQGLASLPNELILTIFNFIEKITDKRQFLKTCKLYNNLTKKSIKDAENTFIKNYCNNGDDFASIYYNLYIEHYYNKDPIKKFTVELCYDSYFDMIPKIYYNKTNSQLMTLLVRYGKLDLLKIAVNNGCLLGSTTCAIAAYNGHLDILKWAYNNLGPWNKSICAYAAENNQLHIIVWARENGCVWNEDTCALAALGGHLDILKWVRANGCEWNGKTTTNAAQNGHLNVLKWAIENGCEWGTRTCLYAKRHGHLELLKWARENGCPE